MYSARAKLWARSHPRVVSFLTYFWRIYWNLIHWGPEWGWSNKSSRQYKLLIRAYRNFKLAPNPENFSKVITCFREGVSLLGSQELGDLVLIGWGDGAFLQNLRTQLSASSSPGNELQMRRFIFRPDTLMMKSNSGNPFCGFKLTIVKSVDFSPERFMSLSRKGLGAVESISRGVSRKSEGFLERLASRNLPALSEMLDWTCDQGTAARVLGWLPVGILGETSFTLASPWLRIGLISGRNVEEVSGSLPKGAQLKTVENPEWIYLDVNDVGASVKHARLVSARYAQIKNARLFGGGTVVTDSTIWNIDSSSHPALDFVAGRWDHVVGSSSNFNYSYVFQNALLESDIESAILLSSRVDQNWFHWLIETLPRITRVEKTIDPSIPLVVSSRLPKTAKESIRLISQRPILEVDETRVTCIKNLIVPGAVIHHPDSTMFWDTPLMEVINQEALEEFRDLVLDKVEINKSAPRNVYISRQAGARNLTNRSGVRRLLSESGFQEIDPTRLTFKEQVQIFQSAHRIVLEGGAAMANLIFCNSNAKAVVLVGEPVKNYKMPSILGSISGASVEVLYGPISRLTKTGTLLNQIHSPYRIRKSFLEAAIGRLLL